MKGNHAEVIYFLEIYCWAQGKESCDCHQSMEGY
jgi:hypothetical protein